MSALADPHDPRRAARADGLLRAFNDAGVISTADVHVAQRLAALAGETDDAVRLAAALAVRAPRLGHVHADLATIRDTATVDADEPVDLSALGWPDATWLDRVAASPLLGGPLRLEGSRLYLDRYWREERRVADDLAALAAHTPSLDAPRLEAGLARLFAGGGRQRDAAAAAVRRGLTVIAGGPGTGKTTTVARIAALLYEQAPLRIGLAAPTGKAAARLEEAVHAEARDLDVAPAVRDQLLALRASTLHRLLGWRPDSHSRFRHNRGQRLPHDVVIVDETSMVSLWQMARLVEAIRPDARLVLVGDPGQLASIEAGAVLGDIVAGGRGIVALEEVHRYGGGIAELAEAIRAGDADAALAVLGGGRDDVTWLPDADEDALRGPLLAAAREVRTAARRGDAAAALAALQGFRLLCPHRRGPHGVAGWTERIEAWLDTGPDPWYAGRPLLVTENDYELRLYNGDTGVVVAEADRHVAAFERGLRFSPTRLSAVDTAYALTIHKSQGSQFGTAAVLLPDPDARILTRELLYTAVTRARERLIVAGSEAALRAAVARPIARASGLRDRLRKRRDPRNGGSAV
jgi:exodeoxyribonuclease V alpha subunit